MKVILLCGGQGTRLKEKTDFIPKSLVRVGDRPLLWHIMKIYAHYGVNEFVIALGYMGDQIKRYFMYDYPLESDFFIEKGFINNSSHISEDNFKIQFVHTGEDTLPGERILRCKQYINPGEQFMVTYGDGVADINIDSLIKSHNNSGKIGTLTTVHPKVKFGTVKIENGDIKEFLEKPVLDSVVNGGFMVFNYEFFNFLGVGEMEHEGLKRLINKDQLNAYHHDGFWYAIDTFKELEELNKMYKDEPQWMVWRKSANNG